MVSSRSVVENTEGRITREFRLQGEREALFSHYETGAMPPAAAAGPVRALAGPHDARDEGCLGHGSGCHGVPQIVHPTVPHQLFDRGAYYTLDSLARFDAQGLWCCRGAWFSRHGTLLDTAAVLVHEAPAGYFVAELETVLHVPVKDPLRQLVRAGRLQRADFAGHYLYTAAERRRRQEQRAARQAQRAAGGFHGRSILGGTGLVLQPAQ